MNNSILTERQTTFLKLLGEDKQLSRIFYLTGGTALAGFYLQHRFSEDLDFFSAEEFDIRAVLVFLKKNKNHLGFEQVDHKNSFNRNIIFLHFGNEVLKTEFTYFPFPAKDSGETKYGVKLDSILDIAINKLFTIYERTKARDYIDLYLIIKNQKYKMEDLIKDARIKFDWHIDLIQLGMQFMKAEEAEDLPKMTVEIQKHEWISFFKEEAKKLKFEIIE